LKSVSFVSVVFFVSFVPFVSFVSVGARTQQPAECTTAPECREMTLAAIAAKDFERAHDLAWRVFQTSPRGNTDAMALLARAQSLSGRADDAVVMLQRLAAAGGRVEDVETSDDFRRVREHPRWPQLSASPRALGAQDANAPSAPAAPSAPKAPVAVEATKAPEAPKAPEEPAAPEAPKAPEAPGLALPSALAVPSAFAYDAVSARFILADAASDLLRVVSEHSGNATTLVSAGWSGHSRVSAVAINRRNGDMWVVAQGERESVVHRFQLVSGRRLQTFSPSDDAGAVRFAAAALAGDALYLLDAAGRRIFVLAANKTLRGLAALPEDIEPLGLTHTGTALLISHAAGLLRMDLGSLDVQPVSAPSAADASGLQSLAWHQGSVLAIQQRTDGARVVRVRFSRRGTAVTAVDVLHPAAALVATLTGNDYYFLSRSPADGLTFRSVPAVK
jgi:hypothetical protein